ncbi:MAG: hypothetical protein IIA99_01385, partial [Proteobacteria bacterium]|nr:hypothetical protein [Pseudomonadota bacterium]
MFSLFTHHSYLHRCSGLILVFLLIFLASQKLYAEDLEEKSAQLDSVRNQIEDVKTNIAKARLKTNTLQAELKKNETSAGNIALNIREIEKQLRQRGKRLEVLNNKKILTKVIDLSTIKNKTKILNIIKKFNPDVVHAFHAFKSGPMALQVAKKLNKPLLVTITGT